ncbi:MAG: patatin-like phospholipase family protein [Thermoflexibacter sp.]|nr:patatin-like phospholipase family protein [Thermoflexibacter sp.]
MGKKLIRILSIDGGGIRGIVPGKILVALEKKLQVRENNPEARIADYFDLVAGTSTGGILTCILLCPDEKNSLRPKYSAQEAVDLYIKNGNTIFSIPLWQKVKSLTGIIEEKYPSKYIENVLTQYLADLKLSQLVKPCLITAYDFYLREVARATSAAPTYFEVALATSLSGVSYPLIDGGVFANNPALCAFAEATQYFSKEDDKLTASEMFIFSIGTGASNKTYEYNRVKKWGVVEWVKPVLDIMMDGVSKTIDYQLLQIYEAIGLRDQYVRVNPILTEAKSDMDNASPENLKALIADGMENAEKFDEVLDKVVEMLIANK